MNEKITLNITRATWQNRVPKSSYEGQMLIAVLDTGGTHRQNRACYARIMKECHLRNISIKKEIQIKNVFLIVLNTVL